MAGERHFGCTACGKCCTGLLPLTLADAAAHADRFPLGVMWTPVRQNQRSFELTARLGTKVRLRDRRTVAVRITAVSYVPPSLPCPALTPDGLCAIHADKPARCRTMPFFPYVEEAEQAAHLVPRKGWDCDVSQAAPIVFRDRNVLDRGDFEAERNQLLTQAPTLRAYADAQLNSVPGLLDKLGLVASRPLGGDVLLGMATLLPHWSGQEAAAFARRQLPVLESFAELTKDDPALAEFHHRYRQWSREMARLAG
jgi:Fe-S-cluster containining protein